MSDQITDQKTAVDTAAQIYKDHKMVQARVVNARTLEAYHAAIADLPGRKQIWEQVVEFALYGVYGVRPSRHLLSWCAEQNDEDEDYSLPDNGSIEIPMWLLLGCGTPFTFTVDKVNIIKFETWQVEHRNFVDALLRAVAVLGFLRAQAMLGQGRAV